MPLCVSVLMAHPRPYSICVKKCRDSISVIFYVESTCIMSVSVTEDETSNKMRATSSHCRCKYKDVDV